MSTQSVIEKILSDGQKEADKILNQYKSKIAVVKKDYAQRIALRKEQIEHDIEKMQQGEFLRIVSQKKLMLNKNMASTKRMFIDKIIDEALESLIHHKKYLEFLIALIEKSGQKNGILIINKKDWGKYKKDLEEFMKKQGYELTTQTNNRISGGLMIIKDKTTYHGSLEIIRELLNDELLIAVAKHL